MKTVDGKWKEAYYLRAWRRDWAQFCREALHVRLDSEQEAIIHAVQHERMVAVASGTARGKDFVAACAALCFMYLTPRWENGRLVKNTKIAMTAPTARQVSNIMMPEISRLMRNAPYLPGRLRSDGIRTAHSEWFLAGFKAGDDNAEAWAGFHAVNTMFIVTEASGISETTFNAIEGNLQGNSRLLLVFNPNVITGYAARAMKSERFASFRLNSLNAENVVKRRNVIPGQVDYEWVKDKVEAWCQRIREEEYNEGDGDFRWEGQVYRPNDLFRVKVLGMFPRASEDTLIPFEWIELANRRWDEAIAQNPKRAAKKRYGVDVAGMGRDSSVICERIDDIVTGFDVYQSGGKAEHMHIAGMVAQRIRGHPYTAAYIDTIGEGAGVYSRLQELGLNNAYSCKFSQSAARLRDTTGQYTFANMRAYLFWAVRDWLDPKNGSKAVIPRNERFAEEANEIRWRFLSNGSIIIEPKDDIKKRIGRSPDLFDALANTFYPYDYSSTTNNEILSDML